MEGRMPGFAAGKTACGIFRVGRFGLSRRSVAGIKKQRRGRKSGHAFIYFRLHIRERRENRQVSGSPLRIISGIGMERML